MGRVKSYFFDQINALPETPDDYGPDWEKEVEIAERLNDERKEMEADTAYRKWTDERQKEAQEAPF